MYWLDRGEFVQPRYVALWALLGFQAGFLNAFGFLACGRYVSHVTGFGTQIGVALAERKPWFALELLGFPLAFILGALTNGWLTAARIERQQKPHFRAVMLGIPIALIVLILLGRAGLFGPFGEQLVLPRDFVLLFALSFICGAQNGAFAVMTRGQIRTTHLTGISTDIGTDLARLTWGQLPSEERILTRRTQACRLATFVAFASGSIASVGMSQHMDYVSLWIPVMTSLIAYVAVWRIGRTLDARAAWTQKKNRSLSSEEPTATLRA